MTSLWATNLQNANGVAERVSAPDVERLRVHVNKFDTPYVEVRLHEHLARIQSKWPLLNESLSVVAEQHRGFLRTEEPECE
ncbi:hypothetical protein [Aliidiomarina sanyensis]|uniref:Uncharacterized protein n=1 Tax=Aliidiomarina sanyensis TaxID=1249555 RepID=A0A432WPV8_9GAMM|nr:hypothetical protein [Aliidiomarina sanyensis]RUO35778.1 hypothetical protein CWE11_03195 [Aliidiomarina sanyensis]